MVFPSELNCTCHLQSYLAWSCIAIWPFFCSGIWHPLTIALSLISP